MSVRPGGAVWGMALALAAAAAPGPGAAQACLGQPVGGLAAHAVVASTAYARYDFGAGASGYELGATYWGNPGGPLAVSAGAARRFMQEGPADVDVAHARVAAELPRVLPLPPGAGACLTAGAAGAWLSDAATGSEYTTYAFPLGLGVGLVLPAGPTTRVYPYLLPQVVLTRGEGEVIGFPVEERHTTFALEAGAGLGRGRLVGRASVLLNLNPEHAGITPLPDLRAGLSLGLRF